MSKYRAKSDKEVNQTSTMTMTSQKNIQNLSYSLKKITLKGNLASKEWGKIAI